MGTATTETTPPRGLAALRDTLARIRADIAEARDRRARGDDAATAKLRELREAEETVADRLALAEAEEAAERAERELAEREAAAQRRAAIEAMLGDKEKLDAEFAAAVRHLRGVMGRMLETCHALARVGNGDGAPFRLHVPGIYVGGYLERAGMLLASAIPQNIPVPVGHVRPLEAPADAWAATERAHLAERIVPE